jgi:LMBR1 domain-containing protein 1
VAVTLYIFLVMSLVGWVLLAFNGGIGLVYLPAELIEYFAMRPKPLTSEEANSKKTELQTLSSELIAEGEQLRSKAEEVQKYEGGWLGRKRTEGKFNSLMEKFKKKVNALEQNFEIFDAELKIRTTHPVVFFLALLGGILGGIVSIFWIVQIIGTMLFRNGQPLFLFMDSWLMSLSRGSASFVATILYGLLVLYLQVCLVKGNTVFGIRIPFLVKLHPLLLNKTYMNSLLFNANLMLLASLSTSLLALWAFPTYLQPTYLSYMQTTAFNNLPLFGSFYGNRIPMIALEAVALLALLVKIGLAIYRSCKSKSK